MDIFGYVVWLIICITVTFYSFLGLLFGGSDLSSASRGLSIFLISLILVVWYFAYQWFPFTVKIK